MRGSDATAEKWRHLEDVAPWLFVFGAALAAYVVLADRFNLIVIASGIALAVTLLLHFFLVFIGHQSLAIAVVFLVPMLTGATVIYGGRIQLADLIANGFSPLLLIASVVALISRRYLRP